MSINANMFKYLQTESKNTAKMIHYDQIDPTPESKGDLTYVNQ